MSEPNFDRIARPYRWLEYLTLGRALERCRLYFLPKLLDCRRALILGDGDGRFTASLLAANHAIEADAIDISAAMLALLRQRSEKVASDASTRLRTHQANALDFAFEHLSAQPYDLIVAHFFLDCLTQHELDGLIARIEPTLAPGAFWLVSDFRIPSSPMRLPARAYIRSLYFAFRVLTGLRTTNLPDHAGPLLDAGFTRKACHHLLAGVLTTELWQRNTPPPASDSIKTHRPEHDMAQPENNTAPEPDKSQPDKHPAPIPDPEPASPSLDEPDPAVFHHTPVRPKD